MNMDPRDLPEEETAEERPDPALSEATGPTRRPAVLRWLVLGSLALAAAFALIVTLVLPLMLEEQEGAIHPEAAAESSTNASVPGQSGIQSGNQPGGVLPYEEPQSTDLQEQAIRVDALITRTLLELGADPQSIEAYAFPARGSEDFRARSLGFLIQAEPVAFQAHLGELLKQQFPDALLTPSGPRQFSIIIDGVRTHELFLERPAAAPQATTKTSELPVGISGKLAIVIDDMGEDTRVARGLAETKMPITFAVWPFSSHKDAIRSLAKEYGLDLLVHLPMEPQAYPDMNPGPGALLMNMTSEEITRTVAENLARVPEAIGVNNHMGSRFTENQSGMTAAIGAMHNAGLFFLDSRTTGKSKALAAAQATQTLLYGRDVFIDNELRVPYIVGQLKKAESLARRRGNAIAIGHPHPETLEGIRTWAAQAGKDVVVVRLGDIKPLWVPGQ